MSDQAEWQKNNEEYLAAGFAWLRLCLMSLAPPPPTIIIREDSLPSSNTAAATSPWNIFRRQKIPLRLPVAEIGAGDAGELLRAQIAEAADDFNSAAAAEPPPALVILSRRLGLSRFEEQILLLCVALELDTNIAVLCAHAQDDTHKQYPTFALALALFDDPAWDALSPLRPLRYLQLIEINQPAAQPLTTSALRIDERILNFIKGLNDFDDRLVPLLVRIKTPEIELPLSQQLVVDNVLREIECGADASAMPLIELTGTDSPSKQLIAAHVASELQLQLFRLSSEALPANAAELETLARLWQREILLKPVALYLDSSNQDGGALQSSLPRRFSRQCQGLIFFDAQTASTMTNENAAAFDVAAPTPAEQKEVWTAQLQIAANDTGGEEIDSFAAQLANQFSLSLPAIHHIVRTALLQSADDDFLRERVWEMCLSGTRLRLDALAQRIEPKALRSDLILPIEADALLKQIVEQVQQRGRVYEDWGFRARMNRGLGISVLFAGESGTGKTMAAEVIAAELRLTLYRIDLSAVVSKFIGETEKNLRRLFDAAEDGGAILFFDEADALFGKRSEVKDSHDRYANIEINYLLQRLENYRGLSILATNMKSALDTAFMRRFRFIVNFAFPAAAERQRIWERVFPPETPIEKLNYERLAQFNLSGGSITNVALGAAFQATRENPARVTMRLIFEAVRSEYRKLDRPVNESSFALPSK